MNAQELKNLNRDELLAIIGLEVKRTHASRWLITTATLGVGMVTGAAMALLFAPRAGRDLRQDLRQKMGRQPVPRSEGQSEGAFDITEEPSPFAARAEV